MRNIIKNKQSLTNFNSPLGAGGPLVVFVLVLILNCISCMANNPNYVVPADLKAHAYPAHTELNWQNRTGFTYEIYRSDDGEQFEKSGETSSDNYLDFFGKPVEKETVYFYRVIPKGLDVKSNDARKFETTVNVKPVTDEALLDMTQRYTTRYFYDFAQPQLGLARERSNDTNGDIITTGGTGFGIMALIAGAERKYFSRNDAYKTIDKIESFELLWGQVF